MSEKAIKLKVSKPTAECIGPGAPKEMRLTAATGKIPVETKELVVALYYLANDKDPEVRREAQKTFLDLPIEKLESVLSSADTHPKVLDYMSRIFAKNSVLELIAMNSASDDATIERIAGKADKELLDLMGRDIERIKNSPEIFEAIKKNPSAPAALLKKIASQLESAAKEEKREAEFPAEFIEEKEGEDSGEVEEEGGSMYSIILDMGVSEKIKLAITGNKEARGILVKDANRLVCGNVMKNPRVTESEVVLFSASKNVSEEVFRLIAANKDWIKNYQVKLNLVSNPRVPIPMAMKFLPHIRDKDLELLSKSRNVSKAVANMAKRILTSRREK